MQLDLLTLYALLVGTLLATASMMFWEQRSNPRRAVSLQRLAAGFAVLAGGCACVLLRAKFPGGVGPAISNLVILTGYLLVLRGVAAFNGRSYGRFSCVLLALAAVAWLVAGSAGQALMWDYITGAPIALVSGLTAWEMYRCTPMTPFSSRRIVIAMTAVHAVFYGARVVALPWVAAVYGPSVITLAGKITMYEGVLYSVVLPMALLKLVREEFHDSLLRASLTDYLTGLGNRRWFFEQGTRLIGSLPERGPLAVLAFDLDHFKAINDLHGHQTGDEVLVSFSHAARRELGANVVLARIGGEEFAAVLVGEQARQARALGEAVAQAFADTLHPAEQGGRIVATVSVGLALFDAALPTLAAGLAEADQALYRAKAQGGNRLVAASDPASPATPSSETRAHAQ